MDENVETRLVRIETKLDLTIGHNQQLTSDHEARLRGLERRFWIAIGFAVASLAANAGQLVTYLGGGVG
jgi:hypothetical protein